MSRTPAAVFVSSRVRCSRCNRFVFRNTACRCQKPGAVYHPQTDGLMPSFRPDPDAHRAPDVYVTARHHEPLDQNGNWSSFGAGEETPS